MNASQVNRSLPEAPAKPGRNRRDHGGEESLFALVMQQSLTPAGGSDANAADAPNTATAASIGEPSASGEAASAHSAAPKATANALAESQSGLAHGQADGNHQMADPAHNHISKPDAGFPNVAEPKDIFTGAEAGKASGQTAASLPMTVQTSAVQTLAGLPSAGTDRPITEGADPFAIAAGVEGNFGPALQPQTDAISSARREQGTEQDPATAAPVIDHAGSQAAGPRFSRGSMPASDGHAGGSQGGSLQTMRTMRAGTPASRPDSHDPDAQALSAGRLPETDRFATAQSNAGAHAAQAGSMDPTPVLDVSRLVTAWNLTAGSAGQTLTVRLAPDVFGAMSIRLEQTRDGLAARIQTDSLEACERLTAQRGQLAEQLLAKGFDCRSIDIVWREPAARTALSGLSGGSPADAAVPEQARDPDMAFGQGQAFGQNQPQAGRQAEHRGARNQPDPAEARPRPGIHLTNSPGGASQRMPAGRFERLA